MSQSRITIIGLGLVGSSIGLALNPTRHVTGYDLDSEQSKRAQKTGAIDERSRDPVKACREADLVVVATPITALRETLDTIGPHLKPGCVVTDTATLKEPVLAWASETLPKEVSFVGGDPTLNVAALSDDLTFPRGGELARADLFQDALYALCPAATADPAAVETVTSLVKQLQAHPFFIDPTEHDGMRAAVDGLPRLVSLALMQQVSDSPGWREARKLADHVLDLSTIPLNEDPAIQRAQLLLNADHVLPRLDALLQELTQLRRQIQEQSHAELEEAFDHAAATRARWLVDRAQGRWDEPVADLQVPNPLSSIGNLFGFGSPKPKDK